MPRTRSIALTLALVGALVPMTPATAVPASTPTSRVQRADDEPDPAAKKRTVDASLASSQTSLAITTQDLADAQTALTTTQTKIATARTELATATANAVAASTRYETAKATVVTADAAVADAQVTLDGAVAARVKAQGAVTSTDASTTTARRRVGSIARNAYKSGGMGNTAATITALGNGGSNRSLTGSMLLMRMDNRAINVLSTQRVEQVASADRLAGVERQVVRAKAGAVQALATAILSRSTASTAKTTADTEKAKKDKAKKDLDALEIRQASNVTTLESKKAGELSAVTALITESDRLTGILRERAAAAARARAAEVAAAKVKADQAAAVKAAAARAQTETAAQTKKLSQGARPATVVPAPAPAADAAPAVPEPEQSYGVLMPPFPMGTVSSPFGYRTHPVLGIRLMHTGVDFSAACGTPLVATRDGVVISAGYEGTYGNRIIVDHGMVGGANLTTLSAHLSGFAVTGGPVKRGQVIGYIGTTGRSTGCHLHFEARDNGTPVDPMGKF